MDAERARAILLRLPHIVETMQWGENLVFWAADKVIGGKMFALIDLDEPARAVISFATAPERGAELCEREGLFPAPYLARAGWVAAERWDALRGREWEELLTEAHATVTAKLPKRTRDVLALPTPQREAFIGKRKRQIASGTKTKPRTAAKTQRRPRSTPLA